MKTITHTPEFIKTTHNLSNKEIAKQIRKDLKEIFGSAFKFSVRSPRRSIEIEAIHGDQEIFTESYKKAESWEDYQKIRENERRFKVINLFY